MPEQLSDSILPTKEESLWSRIEGEYATFETQPQYIYNFNNQKQRLLTQFRARHGYSLGLPSRPSGVPGCFYDMLRVVLSAIPHRLFEAGGLGHIRLGAIPIFARGVATGSEGSLYVGDELAVYLYPDILKESLRTFIAITTHELGHALFQQYLLRKDFLRNQLMRMAWTGLQAERAFLGLDMGSIMQAEERIDYQARTYNEFLAEVFMQYALFHTELRAHIARLSPGPSSRAWELALRVLGHFWRPPTEETSRTSYEDELAQGLGPYW